MRISDWRSDVCSSDLSVNEAAVEARYRFGNFGVVGFLDAGQVYRGSTPTFSDLRFGAGIGARYYTNFGPMRFDVATPLGRRPGEAKIAVYVSIGQAITRTKTDRLYLFEGAQFIGKSRDGFGRQARSE